MEKFTPIVIDFDGTIVTHAYPRIGKPVPHAIETMLEWQKEGAYLILFTMRSGNELNAAVQYCKDNGLKMYALVEQLIKKNCLLEKPTNVLRSQPSKKLISG